MSPQLGAGKTRIVVAIMKGHFCQKLSPSFAPQLELEFVCCFQIVGIVHGGYWIHQKNEWYDLHYTYCTCYPFEIAGLYNPQAIL